MKCLALACGLCGLIASLAAAQALPASILIGNADNQVELRPGASAPQVVRLTHLGGEAWDGTAAEALVDRATVDGNAVPLQWQFDSKSSRVQKNSASLVYETHNPALRLYWEWRAPDKHGPIEHSIRIENRSG